MFGGETGLIVELVSQLGSLGFILWLVWRTTNHTIPRLAESFERNLREAREDFKEMLRQERQDFREMSEKEREFFSRQMEMKTREVTQVVELFKKTHGCSGGSK